MGLTDITTAIADLGDPQLWQCGDRELADLLPALNTAIHTLESARIRLVHEITTRPVNPDGAPENPYADTATWMSTTSVLSYETARKITRLAAALDRHPAVADAFHHGHINTDDATLITRVLDKPPTTIPADAADDIRDYLLLAAHGGSTRLLRNCIGKLATVFPGDDGIPASEDTTRNEFWASPVAGRVVVKGDFDTETGNMLLAALSPLTEPRRNGPDGTDLRSPAQRRADAVTEILRRYLDSGASPTDGGDRPHLHLHVNANDLREHPTTTCPTHGRHTTTDDTPETDTAAPQPEPTADTGIDWTDILHRARTAWLSWTGTLSITAARRIACDCVLTPIVLDPDDTPLNLGRTTRTVSRRLRRAVLARDHGCAFPHCGRPAEWCEVHHATHWIDGGPTDLDNLVMLCGYHHRLIHHSDWEVVIGTDRHPWFIPPTHHDPTRTPIPANGRAGPRTG